MKRRDVAGLVRDLRARLELTQEQFARRLGVTYGTVNHWENGRRAPQPFLLDRLVELKAELEAGGGPSAAPASPRSGASVRAHGRPARRRKAGKAAPGDGAIRRMVDRIVERFDPEKIILFGSRARGEARPDSDVDLLVVMSVRGSRREIQLEVRKALRDIRIPKDVVVTTPEDFDWRRHVVGTIERPASREGRVLYARG